MCLRVFAWVPCRRLRNWHKLAHHEGPRRFKMGQDERGFVARRPPGTCSDLHVPRSVAAPAAGFEPAANRLGGGKPGLALMPLTWEVDLTRDGSSSHLAHDWRSMAWVDLRQPPPRAAPERSPRWLSTRPRTSSRTRSTTPTSPASARRSARPG